MKCAQVKTLRVATLGVQELYLEVCIQPGLPKLHLCVKGRNHRTNLKQRLAVAFRASGYQYPKGRITARLSTLHDENRGELPWEPIFDLPLAVALLVADGQIRLIHDSYIFGSFDLQGRLIQDEQSMQLATWLWEEQKPCFLAQSILSKLSLQLGAHVPASWLGLQNISQLRNSPSVKRVGFTDITNEFLLSDQADQSMIFSALYNSYAGAGYQLCMEKQAMGILAVELALCGFHSLLLVGSPGSGKTTLTRFAKYLTPELRFSEKLQKLRLFSLAGRDLGPAELLYTPFLELHAHDHPQQYIWQRKKNQPGVLLLAHGGILLLDDFHQFKQAGVDLIKRAMEDHFVSFDHETCWHTKPSEFILLATMNPCPCGMALSAEKSCSCSSVMKDRYWQKIDQALLDRFDLFVPMRELEKTDWQAYYASYSQENQLLLQTKINEVKERVQCARERQRKRFTDVTTVLPYNALVPDSHIHTNFGISKEVYQFAGDICSQLQVSGRRFNRILRLARTIADFLDEDRVLSEHIQQALQFRPLLHH